jgi:hypothetical protein
MVESKLGWKQEDRVDGLLKIRDFQDVAAM